MSSRSIKSKDSNTGGLSSRPIVSIDIDRIRALGEFLKTLPACSPSDWTFDGLPPVADPHAADYFFIAVKHQYGFWLEDAGRYLSPMFGVIDGRRLKGSDFVWHALRRSLARDAGLYNMERQSVMSDSQIFDVFADDEGKCPLPIFETHCEIWREYSKDMLKLKHTPQGILESRRRNHDPVSSILRILSNVGGYKEDPLAKKASLLAVILANRPERFLSGHPPLGFPPGTFPPIVDYHIQRSALRVGLVKIDDPKLEKKIQNRRLISETEETAIRNAVYEAMLRLEEKSGKGIDALDWFFFQNRRRCPEMSDPDCLRCEIENVCPKRKDLFQPVRRTTYY